MDNAEPSRDQQECQQTTITTLKRPHRQKTKKLTCQPLSPIKQQPSQHNPSTLIPTTTTPNPSSHKPTLLILLISTILLLLILTITLYTTLKLIPIHKTQLRTVQVRPYEIMVGSGIVRVEVDDVRDEGRDEGEGRDWVVVRRKMVGLRRMLQQQEGEVQYLSVALPEGIIVQLSPQSQTTLTIHSTTFLNHITQPTSQPPSSQEIAQAELEWSNVQNKLIEMVREGIYENREVRVVERSGVVVKYENGGVQVVDGEQGEQGEEGEEQAEGEKKLSRFWWGRRFKSILSTILKQTLQSIKTAQNILHQTKPASQLQPQPQPVTSIIFPPLRPSQSSSTDPSAQQILQQCLPMISNSTDGIQLLCGGWGRSTSGGVDVLYISEEQ